MVKKVHEETAKATLPPIDSTIHFQLKEYCLHKTRELNHLVTLGEIVETAISRFIEKK